MPIMCTQSLYIDKLPTRCLSNSGTRFQITLPEMEGEQENFSGLRCVQVLPFLTDTGQQAAEDS